REIQLFHREINSSHGFGSVFCMVQNTSVMPLLIVRSLIGNTANGVGPSAPHQVSLRSNFPFDFMVRKYGIRGMEHRFGSIVWFEHLLLLIQKLLCEAVPLPSFSDEGIGWIDEIKDHLHGRGMPQIL